MSEAIFNWQQDGWPNATVNQSALKDELKAFKMAFVALKECLGLAQDAELTAETLTNEAVTTSAIEGVHVDESVVMSSICRALGVTTPPMGFAKDARAEGIAAMILAVRREWNDPLSAALVRRWHGDLMSGDVGRVTVGEFRKTSVFVVRRHADGTEEVRFEAPPSARVAGEVRDFVGAWKRIAKTPEDVAFKAALMHPHFESIHPFEDGNGRVGRALVAKVLAEGLGAPLVLPVSTVIARHRAAYYDEINEASRTLDWTNWCAFFIPVLTEIMTSFVAAMRFVKAKRDYLEKYESGFSERAKKVILRMFEDGEKGAKGVLSAAKWMRMAKVSKPTAIADLQMLEKQGAVVRIGDDIRLEYRLSGFTVEPINEPLNGGLNEHLLKLVKTHPGVQLPYLKSVVGKSLATVKRFIAALVAEGLVEHRGSKKTGGYYLVEKS